MPRKSYCQRRVNQVRCTEEAIGFCAKHFRVKCSNCNTRPATYECTWNECKKPLCSTCQCHGSFGK